MSVNSTVVNTRLAVGFRWSSLDETLHLARRSVAQDEGGFAPRKLHRLGSGNPVGEIERLVAVEVPIEN